MKLIGGLATEVANIIALIEDVKVDSIVMNFVAFLVIIDIDNLMAGTVRSIDVTREIKYTNIKYPKSEVIRPDWGFIKTLYNKNSQLMIPIKKFWCIFFIICHSICDFIYTVFYYYFMPFFMIIFIITFG